MANFPLTLNSHGDELSTAKPNAKGTKTDGIGGMCVVVVIVVVIV